MKKLCRLDKGNASIISAFHKLKHAKLNFEDVVREIQGQDGKNFFNNYIKKIEWFKNDFIIHPFLSKETVENLKREWETDSMQITELERKVALLNPQQRDIIELMMDEMLAGEEIKFEEEKK